MASFTLEDWKEDFLPNENKENTRLVGIEFEAEIKPSNQLEEDFKFLSEDWLDSNDIGYNEEYDDTDWTDRGDWIKDTLAEKNVFVGGVGYDGGGKEFVTYPDSVSHYKKGGSERFKNVISMLANCTNADSSSGTHIHISKLPSDTPTTWNNLYWFSMAFAPQIQKIFGRESHWCRTPLPETYFRENNNNGDSVVYELPQKQPVPANIYNKGTIIVNRDNRYEFRGGKASHDIEEVLAWVEFCNNVVEMCANGYIKQMPFATVLQGKYIRKYLNRIGANNPKRKITEEERAMKISNIKYVKVNTSSNTVF